MTHGEAMEPMTHDELLALPVVVDAKTAFRAIGVGQVKGYEMVRRNEFPVPVRHRGNRIKVLRSDLLVHLGVSQQQDGRAAG